MYIDATLATAIGAVFSMAMGAIGWLVKALWGERTALTEKFVAMLDRQYADADKRKDLWEAQAKVIDGQTRSITDMIREITTLREEVRRLKP